MLSRYGQYLWYSGQAEMWKKTEESLEQDPDAYLLDLGCYSGETTLKCAQIVGTRNVFGIEITDEMLLESQSRGIMVSKSDLNLPLPIESESMSLVIANQVIEHLVNLDNFISEIFRVLKTGGYLLLTTENLASWHNIFALLIGNQPFTGPELSTRFDSRAKSMHHVKVGTFKALKRLFTRYGFQIERMEGCGYHPFPGILARALSRANPSHSHFVVLKARKP